MIPGAPGALPPDWPLAAMSHTAKVAPYRWHLAAGGVGHDMLLLHGAGASAHSWGALVPHLHRRFRVLAPDLPGHGLTRAQGLRSALPAMTQDLAALIKGIGAAPRVIIGHSAGGALALSLAAALPRPPRAVVVLNGAVENFRGAAGVLFPAMARALTLNPFVAPVVSQTGAGPGVVERLIAGTGAKLPASAIGPYQYLIRDRRHVAGTLAMMSSWSLSGLQSLLPKIEVPTLFLHGAKDRAVDADVPHRAAKAMPAAEVEVLSGLGHLVHEEAPKRVAERIMAFLEPRLSRAG